MPGLRIAVLGKPRVTRDDDSPVELGSAKATALLLYLATTGERHSRSALAGLLWGDLPEDGARANLRLALTKLRRVADDNLQVTRGYVAVDPSSYWLDRRELEAALAGGTATWNGSGRPSGCTGATSSTTWWCGAPPSSRNGPGANASTCAGWP